MSKFKVGDEVRVIADIPNGVGPHGIPIGTLGEITDYTEDGYPYELDYRGIYLKECEIQLADEPWADPNDAEEHF